MNEVAVVHEPTASKGDAQPVVELIGISKSFESDGRRRTVLRDVSLAALPGEILWLRGESGAGKSSLLRVVALLSTPSSGTLKIVGEPHVPQRSADVRRKMIGLVFQNGNLLPGLTLRDNVAIASRRPDYETVDRLLDEFGLAAASTTRGKEASGGQAQRTALCRALVNDPAIILADEPTAGLDSHNSAVVMAHLERLAASGRAVIIASHDESVAAVATRAVTIAGGQIV